VREGAPVRALVLDMAGVHSVDITGIEVLREYFETLGERGIKVCMIYLRQSAGTSLSRAPHFPTFTTFRNINEMRQALVLTPHRNHRPSDTRVDPLEASA